MYNAVTSPDQTTRLYPEGHALYALVRPTFNTVRRALAGPWISCIWNDASQDPTRAGFRPSYDELYGPGSVNLMPFIACWMSTGPDTEDGGNLIVLPSAIDRSVVQFMIDRALARKIHVDAGAVDGSAGGQLLEGRLQRLDAVLDGDQFADQGVIDDEHEFFPVCLARAVIHYRAQWREMFTRRSRPRANRLPGGPWK